MQFPKHIVITGASSGIGAALAMHYAAPGIRLSLAGRDADRLQQIANACRFRGAQVSQNGFDITDAPAASDWLLGCDSEAPVDLVIANAGISAGSGLHGETPEQAYNIFAVNLNGVLNTVLPLIPAMRKRGRGQIALMSSLAGLRGLPSAPAYSASKNAVRAYGEALRGFLQETGVEVSVVCPGYIRTPLTARNPFPMPFLMEPEKAARIIARGLARNKGRIAFPLPLYLPLYWLTCLSTRVTDPLFARLPTKPADHEVMPLP